VLDGGYGDCKLIFGLRVPDPEGDSISCMQFKGAEQVRSLNVPIELPPVRDKSVDVSQVHPARPGTCSLC